MAGDLYLKSISETSLSLVSLFIGGEQMTDTHQALQAF